MSWKNLKIGAKLSIAFALLIIIGFAIGLVGYKALENYEMRVHKSKITTQILENLLEARSFEKDFMIVHNQESIDKGLKIKQELQTNIKEIKSLFTDQKDVDDINILKQESETYFKYLEEYERNYMLNLKNSTKKDSLKADTFTKSQAEQANFMITSAEGCINKINKIKTGQELKMQKEHKYALNIIIGFIIIGFIMGVMMAYIIVPDIKNRIKQTANIAESIASGDLTIDLPEADLKMPNEFGNLARSMQKTITELRKTIAQVSTGANNIASASEQLSSTSQSISQGATEQSASTEEVSASMEEMTSNIEQNTENAQETEKLSETVNHSIQEVGSKSQESLKSINEIAKKVTIINDIALQTNILALNAAVEAARAGEQGKGFAVVAAEVRKLAERSKVASDEIDKLSKYCVEITEDANKLMEELVPNVQKTSSLVGEITAASTEQNSGANQINETIQQLNNVTQVNASASEEMAASAEEMANQADQLKEVLSYFTVNNKEGNYIKKTKEIVNKIKEVSNEKKEVPNKNKQPHINEQKSVDDKITDDKSKKLIPNKDNKPYQKEQIKPSNNGAKIIMSDDHDDEFERY